MGIINIVKTVKEIHREDIVLVKIGKFYHVYGKDAYIISYLFQYKLKEIENVFMCGFPIQSISKIMAELETKKINYLILDRRNNYDVDEVSSNKNLNQYSKYLEKSKSYIKYRNRIDNIYKFMLDNIQKEEMKNIIKQMEEIINERRKIQTN